MNRDYLSDSEYRSAKRAESFKWELMNVINQVMKQAKSKKQFCYLMKQQGYDVRWEENRKYITYTCPNKRNCRDNKLHGDKYRKEMLEHEFEIRRTESDVQQGIVGSGGHSADSGGARFQLESADRIEQTYVAGTVRDTANAIGAVNESRDRADAENSTLRTGKYHSDLSGTVGSNVGKHDVSCRADEESNSGPRITGWEAERAVWLETERARRIQAQAQIESCQVDGDIAVSLDSIVGGVTAVASICLIPARHNLAKHNIISNFKAKKIAQFEPRKGVVARVVAERHGRYFVYVYRSSALKNLGKTCEVRNFLKGLAIVVLILNRC